MSHMKIPTRVHCVTWNDYYVNDDAQRNLLRQESIDRAITAATKEFLTYHDYRSMLFNVKLEVRESVLGKEAIAFVTELHQAKTIDIEDA